MRTIFFLLIVPFVFGCQTSRDSVPVAVFKFNPATGEIVWQSPKDVSSRGFRASHNADGSSQIEWDTLESKMNPDVITMSGAAYIGQIHAIGDVVSQSVAAAASAAATSGAAPAAKSVFSMPPPQLK